MENFNMKSLNHTDNIGGGAAIGGGGTADEPPINFEIKKLIDKIITYSTSIPSEREEKGEEKGTREEPETGSKAGPAKSPLSIIAEESEGMMKSLFSSKKSSEEEEQEQEEPSGGEEEEE